MQTIAATLPHGTRTGTEAASAMPRKDPAGAGAAAVRSASGDGARSAEDLAHQVEQASRHLERLNRRLRCSLDDASGRMVVAIIDSDTSEVIRQFPAEEMLEVSRRLDEQLASQARPTGLLLTDQA